MSASQSGRKRLSGETNDPASSNVDAAAHGVEERKDNNKQQIHEDTVIFEDLLNKVNELKNITELDDNKDELKAKVIALEALITKYKKENQDRNDSEYAWFERREKRLSFWHQTAYQCMEPVYTLITRLHRVYDEYADEIRKKNIPKDKETHMWTHEQKALGQLLDVINHTLYHPDSKFNKVSWAQWVQRRDDPSWVIKRFPLNKQEEQDGWKCCDKCEAIYDDSYKQCTFCCCDSTCSNCEDVPFF